MSDKKTVPDIFVSYAHVDNQPLAGAEKGWITHFAHNLKNNLSRRLGRNEHYELWMDFKLTGNYALTPDIHDKLSRTHTLLLFLSPAYIASEWCLRELEAFVTHNPEHNGRIFVVELEEVHNGSRPKVLSDLLGYRFWYKDHQGKLRQYATPRPDPTEREYYDRLVDVSVELATTLKRLWEIEQLATEASETCDDPPHIDPSHTDKQTVYLAPVADSLENQREETIRYLQQYDIAVLPKKNRITFSNYQEQLLHDLAQSSHFIQLLNDRENMGIPLEQYKLAQQQDKPTVQWRDHRLQLENVEDPEQRILLSTETVVASNLNEFHQHLLKQLLEPEEEPDHSQLQNKLVFVNTGQDDIHLAEEVCQRLSDRGIACLWPMLDPKTHTPAAIREDLEQNMLHCDMMLLLYEKSPPRQIREYLIYAMRVSSKRPQRNLNVALCKHQNMASLNVRLPNLNLLECTIPEDKDFADHCIRNFIQTCMKSFINDKTPPGETL